VTALNKRDAERLLATYDDAPVEAVTTALRVVLDRPDLDFTALVKLAGFTCDRRIRLQAQDPTALDELVTELNELRGLSPRP
jgi:hypothetical protein